MDNVKFLSATLSWRFWPAWVIWFITLATLIVPMHNKFVRSDQSTTSKKQRRLISLMINGFFTLNVWHQVLLLLVTVMVFIAAFFHNPDPGIFLEQIGEFGQYWFYHLRWCFLVVVLGLIYFWPVYAKSGSILIAKHRRFMLIWQTVMFLLCAAISFWVIQVNHVYGVSNALINPVETLYMARMDFVKSGDYPLSRAEMLERYPNLEPLEYYGKWCYYYRPEENDFYLVANYSDLWFVYDATDKREMTDKPDESIWSDVIDRCTVE